MLLDLVKLGIWNPILKNKITAANGSVQDIPVIPQEIKEIYKTVWEIKQRTLIDMAADRGAFICQSQSLNLFIQDANFAKLTSMHFYSWKKGLKTGMYYLRTKAAADAIKFTIEKNQEPAVATASRPISSSETVAHDERLSEIACSLDNPDACEACSG